MYALLMQNQIKCVKVHGETKPTVRIGLLDQYQSGEVDVLICTDLGSRGINTVRVMVINGYLNLYYKRDHVLNIYIFVVYRLGMF